MTVPTVNSTIVVHAPLHTVCRAEHTMAMPAIESRRWTAAEVRALPQEPGKQYEVIDGELFVSPGPAFSHQSVAVELTLLLRDYVRRDGIGYVLNGPGEIEPDLFTLVQPDIFVVPAINGKLPVNWEAASRLLLVVEILSPSSGRTDRVRKRRLYQRMDVEYWIVDVSARVIERWLPTDERAELLDERLVWRADGTSDVLAVDINALFIRALGE